MKRPSQPSGAQNRKRRKEGVEKNPRSKATGPASSSSSSRITSTSSESQHEEDDGAVTQPEDTPTPSARPELHHESLRAAPLDPADWPSLSDMLRLELVHRGPHQISSDFHFPKREDGRSCHHHHFHRQLINGERIKRSWMVYSIKNDSLYCFCCKLFSQETYKLISDGLNDWENCSEVLKSHENSPEHYKHMKSWKELKSRLDKGLTVDRAETTLIEAERRRRREVLTRAAAIIQSLAERNLALRGTTDKLYQPNNGHFLKEVELMAKSDPVLKQHVADVETRVLHTSCFGKNVQTELIECIGGKIAEAMAEDIRQNKYYSIILDCSPDLSQKEQLSVIIRHVAVEDTPQIREYFLGFLEAEDSTGEDLSALILNRLEELSIPFEDCRGQSYDNGANMKGRKTGVQARLLEKNPRALLVPCGAHTVSLVIADAAKSSTDATCYFGYLQKLFTLFSASTQRWSVLENHVTTALKSDPDTRWEGRIMSVEAVRYQAAGVRDALLEVRDSATDPQIRFEAQSLAEEVGSYRFSICTVVWHDILTNVHHVSKLLQSETMHMSVAVELLKKTEASLVAYRDSGFASAQVSAKEMCDNMNVEAALKQKRLRRTERQFSYEDPEQEMTDALKKMEMSFFSGVVDVAIVSLQERVQTLGEVEKTFGVLVSFPHLTSEELMKHCETLSNTLSCSGQSDLDWRELAQELQSFPELKGKMTTFELLSFLQENRLKEVYPNMWVALRIAVTIPVTAAAAESSFSKLQLIRAYLRSPMCQERLDGLALMSINREVSRRLSLHDAVEAVAAKQPDVWK